VIRWLGWLLVLPLPVLAYASWSYGLLDGIRRDYLLLLWTWILAVTAIAAVAGTVRRARGAGAGTVPALVGLLVLAAFTYYAGAAALFASVMLALVAIAIGTLFRAPPQSSSWSALLAGMAVMSAVVGWLLPFHVHDGRLYLVVMGGVVLLRRRAVAGQLQAAMAGWNGLAARHPWMLTVAVATAGVASLGLWLPSLNYDDNAAHLILPNQLLAGGYYTLDVSSQLAAVQPWANNVLHGIGALVAGQVVPPALNALWLVIGLAGAYRLARALGGPAPVALAAAAVYASHPLSAHFASTMQVDGPIAAVLLHLAADMAHAKGRLSSPWITGAILGLLAGLKVSNVLYVFFPLAWWAWLAVRDREWKPFAVLVLAAAVVGGASYAYATLITGNPVFPFLNGIFKSPFLPPIDLHDTRWDTGVQWRAIWDLTFATSRFSEAAPGAAGLALMVALPGLVAMIIARRDSRWIGLWMLASGALMFWQIQYLRYVFPAIAVLVTIGIAGLGRYLPRLAFAGVVVLLVVANACLMPTTSWIARDNPWGRLVHEGVAGKAGLVRSMLPERALLDRLYLRMPDACVLMTDPRAPFVGTFKGRANTVEWYDPRLEAANAWAAQDSTGERWQQVIRAVGASHLVVAHQQDTPLAKALHGMGFEQVDAEGSTELWASAVAGQRHCNRHFLDQRDQARHLIHWGQP
jgi:hypothetical protein